MVRLKPGQTLEAGDAALRGVQPQIRERRCRRTGAPQDKADIPQGWLLADPGGHRRLGTRASATASR